MSSIMFPVAVIGGLFFLLRLLLPVALLIALQVWLSKKGKWLGLILPCLSLALSLLLVFSLASFTRTSESGVKVTDENGQVVYQPTQSEHSTIQSFVLDRGTVIAVSSVFLVANIPTVIFGGIWLHYKGRRDTLADLERMKIEDLG